MIEAEAHRRTQSAQAADWQALTSPSPDAAPPTGLPVAVPRRNALALALSGVWLVAGGVFAVRYLQLTPAPGAGRAVIRDALVGVYALAALAALRYVLFTFRGRLAVSEGRLSHRGALLERSCDRAAITRVVAMNTSTQERSPHINYVFVGEGSAFPVVRGSRFSADSVARVASALGLRIEVVTAPVTVSQLLDMRRGRTPIPTP